MMHRLSLATTLHVQKAPGEKGRKNNNIITVAIKEHVLNTQLRGNRKTAHKLLQVVVYMYP